MPQAFCSRRSRRAAFFFAGRGALRLSAQEIRGACYLLLPQFEQSDARLADADFFVTLVLQFLLLVCFISLPPAFMMRICFVLMRTPTGKNRKRISVFFRARAHTIRMNTRNKKDINPIDRMIQSNKDEADSMLSLWGLKKRRHIKNKPIKK